MLEIQINFYSPFYYWVFEVLRGTVSLDLDGLFVIWMDRALFGDEPLTGFTYNYLLLPGF